MQLQASKKAISLSRLKCLIRFSLGLSVFFAASQLSKKVIKKISFY
jgi:hypothetical protein